MNWRGRPLTSHEVIILSIAATTTRTGLKVRAEPDHGSYAAGVKISDGEIDALPLTRHDWHGDWSYTLRPEPPAASRRRPHTGRGPARTPRAGTPRADRADHRPRWTS